MSRFVRELAELKDMIASVPASLAIRRWLPHMSTVHMGAQEVGTTLAA